MQNKKGIVGIPRPNAFATNEACVVREEALAMHGMHDASSPHVRAPYTH